VKQSLGLAISCYRRGRRRKLHVAIKAIDEVKSQQSPTGKISVGKVADIIDNMLYRPPKDRAPLNNFVSRRLILKLPHWTVRSRDYY
jgi:hypothetical protein